MVVNICISIWQRVDGYVNRIETNCVYDGDVLAVIIFIYDIFKTVMGGLLSTDGEDITNLQSKFKYHSCGNPYTRII